MVVYDAYGAFLPNEVTRALIEHRHVVVEHSVVGAAWAKPYWRHASFDVLQVVSLDQRILVDRRWVSPKEDRRLLERTGNLVVVSFNFQTGLAFSKVPHRL